MTEKVMLKMIRYFGKDVRRINHAIKVFGLAGCIARNEKMKAGGMYQEMAMEIPWIKHPWNRSGIGILKPKRVYH